MPPDLWNDEPINPLTREGSSPTSNRLDRRARLTNPSNVTNPLLMDATYGTCQLSTYEPVDPLTYQRVQM